MGSKNGSFNGSALEWYCSEYQINEVESEEDLFKLIKKHWFSFYDDRNLSQLYNKSKFLDDTGNKNLKTRDKDLGDFFPKISNKFPVQLLLINILKDAVFDFDYADNDSLLEIEYKRYGDFKIINSVKEKNKVLQLKFNDVGETTEAKLFLRYVGKDGNEKNRFVSHKLLAGNSDRSVGNSEEVLDQFRTIANFWYPHIEELFGNKTGKSQKNETKEPTQKANKININKEKSNKTTHNNKKYRFVFNGYGGEVAEGIISKEAYDYWEDKQSELQEYLFSSKKEKYEKENSVPTKAKFPGAWNQRKDIVHCSGVEKSGENYLIIEELDKNGNLLKSWKNIKLDRGSLEKAGITDNELGEYDADHEKVNNKTYIYAQSLNKGSWSSSVVDLKEDLDLSKLVFNVIIVEGWILITNLIYNNKIEIDLEEESENKSQSAQVLKG